MYANTWARQNIAATNTKEMNTPVLSQGWRGQLSEVKFCLIETSLSKGKGGKLTLTGNLGDVMKESAMLALEYLKAHTKLLNLQEDIFDNWNIHIHVPEGAIPKDGPSAGITMVTSLASALTQRKVKANLAMTGEITYVESPARSGIKKDPAD